MEEVTRGRITYFEPNELFGDDNQPVNQEELTKYVNLSVRIPSRFYDENKITKDYESILKGTPFVDRDTNVTKLYLTDNYVNVSYCEYCKNNQINVGELFGIESINISFDVQFQPLVTINFNDVKGLGLMSTMQYNYENNNLKNLSAKSFFTALFNYPYPIFTLEVKGYYGKSMSFDLALKDFNTSFDSSTGNFKTTVSFIGHLYGVYADIPMSYLLVSPYIDVTAPLDSNETCGNVWNSLTQNENAYNESYPTFIGIVNKYKDILNGKNINEETSNAIGAFQDKINQLKILNEIKVIYDEIIFACDVSLNNHCVNEKDIVPCSEEHNTKVKTITLSSGETIKYKEEGIRTSFFFKKGEDITNNLTVLYDLNHSIETKKFPETYKLDYTIYTLQRNNTGNTEYSVCIFTDIYQKKDEINQKIKEYEGIISGNTENTMRETMVLIKNNLGFKPTVKNIYKILFKHLDCFSKHFYSTIKNVDINRNKRNLGIENIYSSDVYGFENNEAIPPFPMFSQINGGKNEIVYPGKINGFTNQPEVILTEKIFNSIAYSTNIYNQAKQELINTSEQISTQPKNDSNLYFSFFNEIENENINSYSILQYVERSKYAEYICKIFLRRLSTFYRLHTSTDTKVDDLNWFINNECNLIKKNREILGEDVLLALERYYQPSLYNTFAQNSGTTESGYTGYSIDGGDDPMIKNENSIRVIKKGSRSICEEEINSYQIDDTLKFIFPIHENFYVNTFKTGNFLQHSYRTVLTIIDSDGNYLDCDDVISKGSKWLQFGPADNIVKELNISYAENASTFYHKSLGDVLSYFDWACSKYKKKYETWEFCRNTRYSYKKEHKPGVGAHWCCNDVYAYSTTDYWDVVQNNKELNKIVLIDLVHLLALGNLFLNKDNFIPVTYMDRDETASYFNSPKKFYFCRYFEPHGKLKDMLIGLYKTFYNLSPSDDDKKYYNMFLDESDNITKDNLGDNLWFVISKEQFNSSYGNLENREVLSLYNNFLNKIFPLYGHERNMLERAKNNVVKTSINEDIKTSIYYSLKTLYEKWYSGLKSDFFDLYNENNNQFKRIEYLTTTFVDISDDLMINLENFINITLDLKSENGISNKNMLTFMSDIAQNNQSTFLVLPTKIYNENLKDAFKTFNFYNNTLEHDEYGSTYIVMHNTNVSHHLNNDNSEYEDDGYVIADFKEGILSITDDAFSRMHMATTVESLFKHTINAFGVTYGMQNQNFFKNISIDTQTPQMTDYSIANLLNIAEQGSDISYTGKYHIKNESLYPVYANRSYTCSVEMMGCMNITPLMYFQLNNIPMFKGAYLIINVEHRITPDDFITTFTGVRVSKYNIPLNTRIFDLSNVGRIRINSGETSNHNNDTNNEPVSSIGNGQAVNINTDNDTVNLNIKDGKDCKCFFGYEHNCDKKKKNPNCNTHGNKECCDCHRSAVLSVKCLLEKHGIKNDNSYASMNNSIRLTYEKNNKLYYFCLEGENYKDKYDTVVKSIINHLDNKKPVIVGVNHTFNKGINEGTSDHWVTIYAYGYSGTTLYFRYFESGSNSASSDNRDDIFLYEEGDKPKLYNKRAHPSGGKGPARRYDVTVVKLWHDISTLGYTLQSYKQGSSVSSIPIDDPE